VAQLIADIFQRLTILNEQRRKRVPEVVKTYSPQSCLLQAPEEHAVLDVVHVCRIAFPVAENPLWDFIAASGQPFFFPVTLQFPEFSQECV
jgi:hypothetical protein